jgi:hypothetical protein
MAEDLGNCENESNGSLRGGNRVKFYETDKDEEKDKVSEITGSKNLDIPKALSSYKSSTLRSVYTSDYQMGADQDNLKRKTVVDLISQSEVSYADHKRKIVINMLSDDSDDFIQEWFDKLDNDNDGKITKFAILNDKEILYNGYEKQDLMKQFLLEKVESDKNGVIGFKQF